MQRWKTQLALCYQTAEGPDRKRFGRVPMTKRRANNKKARLVLREQFSRTRYLLKHFDYRIVKRDASDNREACSTRSFARC